MRQALIATVILLCATNPVRSQTTVADSGSRIRIGVAETSEKVTGKLVSITADSLVYSPEYKATRNALPMSKVGSLEVSEGYQQSGTAVVVGAGLGGLTGVGLSAAMIAGDHSLNSLPLLTIAPLLIVGGIVAGALIGSNHYSEKWSPIHPADGEVGVLVGPNARGGVTVGFSIPFDAPAVFETSSDSITTIAEAP